MNLLTLAFIPVLPWIYNVYTVLSSSLDIILITPLIHYNKKRDLKSLLIYDFN